MNIKLRDARDEDGDQLIALIERCYAEYRGCILDVDGEVPELKAIATHHAKSGGRFWVAESGGQLVGSVGVVSGSAPGVMEMKKVYVAKDARQMGLGARLCSLAEAEAMSRRATDVELWSDTRFEDAHRMYERRGYVPGPTRELHDKSKSIERYFRKAL